MGFEWTHRVIASVVALIFVVLAAFAWRNRGRCKSLPILLSVGVALLAIQIVLGGLTVLQLLVEWSVVLHLLMGNLFCLVLFLIALRLLGAAEPAHAASGAHRSIAIAAAIALFIQIVLGGLVSASYAGLACPEWPACIGGEWFPPFSGLVGLHLSHRLGAYTLVVLYLILASTSARDPLMRHLTRVALSLVLFQILIGVMNVLLRLPVEITALHSATVTLLVLVTGTIVKSVVSDPPTPPGRPMPGGES